MILVKLLSDDSGELKENPVWCYSDTFIDPHALCTTEYYGPGQSGCEYETKEVKRGGITCKNCLEFIKNIKAIKL